MKKFEGICAALLTPYDESGKVNCAMLKKQVRWLIGQGIDGFYVCGSTGEAFLLSPQERMAILDAVCEENNGEKLVIAHIGQIATEHALELGRHAKAAGADAILLDVKMGSGAFMKTLEDSRALAREMVRIGSQVGRRTVALITDMDMPLGSRIGNALEVQEAVEVLSGKGDRRLRALCLELSANMIYLGGHAPDMPKARAKAVEAVRSGRALEKLRRMVEAQGGDPSYITNPEKFTISPACVEIAAPQTGYITRLDAEGCGLAAVELGAGRETKESLIDFGAGIVLLHNKGDRVEQGQPIARLYAQSEAQCRRGAERFLQALEVGQTEPQTGPMLVERVAEK